MPCGEQHLRVVGHRTDLRIEVLRQGQGSCAALVDAGSLLAASAASRCRPIARVPVAVERGRIYVEWSIGLPVPALDQFVGGRIGGRLLTALGRGRSLESQIAGLEQRVRL